ncbi:hypothetical protein C922_05684 [Plasmodium inui San Antonio 1]|uniref:Uncharacterized protein n=1 Tax=Plasmodium inui San Antonio 1 TaxID=1237626 RepID=W6ZXE9_9APIC|nr:hypothetical protein C922_05684 [Plasmodium inui San Antonio 1]EUD63935.1 hypothetical protein C922_05684 [Plasmodium inui San Antonio 1]
MHILEYMERTILLLSKNQKSLEKLVHRIIDSSTEVCIASKESRRSQRSDISGMNNAHTMISIGGVSL